ncbi:hypothetical protein [Propionivibrio soli]|uniref:hypothetical protein n=1 Tax=Propionivibrio soli TaxID=2976531 RepID=UPI0021E7C01E|nr:hypothetical protein [Propionivibrio soli]
MNRREIATAVAILWLANSTAFAGGGMGGGATEVTQIINMTQLIMSYAQQVEQYAVELKQYETMTRNLMENPAGVLAPDLTRMASNASRIMAVGKDIASSMARVDANFASTFNNPTAASFGAKFAQWTDASNDALRASLRNAGLQREQFKDDNAALQAMTQSVAQSQGNLAALQALGSLNAAQIQESMKLRDLVSQQQVAQNTYLAAQNAKDQAKQDDVNVLLQPYSKKIPTISSEKTPTRNWTATN